MSGAGLSFLRERQKSLPRTGLATLSALAPIPCPHLAVHYGPVPDIDFRLRLLVLVIRSYGSLRLRF